MSSQAFHRTPGGRVQEIITRERFKSRILESFDPMTQELYRLLPAIIHNNPTIQKAKKIEVTTRQQSQNMHGRETEGLDRTTQRRKKNWQRPDESIANP
jgi:hypothetical protein